jgi:CDP-alcohol phosphatidyltransferase
VREGRAGGATTRAGGGPQTQSAVITAALLATAPAADEGPAAALAWPGGTVLARLLEQLAALGVQSAHVITRPGWEEALRPSLRPPGGPSGLSVQLHVSPDTAGDLRLLASIARAARGGLVVSAGEVVTHGAALAGLLGDPRLGTGVLTSGRRLEGASACRAGAEQGRVVSTSSPYHSVRNPDLVFLGVLKVAPGERAAVADVAERLAALVAPPLPAGWDEELHRTAAEDARRSGDDEAVQHWLAVETADAASLLLTGLVRSGVNVGTSDLREFFWARPLSQRAAAGAADRIGGYDEDRALLDSAVKSNDGFFTTFFVSPYSKYIARWAARRGFTPNQVTTVSLGIGVLAAIAFATGERAGLIAGAILLQVAFTTDCVDGQLARYTSTFSRFGAWLDSILDRTKEYLAYAGLAIGASRTGDPVWVLAGAALALQTMRHAIDFSYPVAQQQAAAAAPQPPIEQPADGPGAAPAPTAARTVAAWRWTDRRPAIVWVKKIVAFPIGERFAAISITAAIWDARTTFVVLLAWGGVATAYRFAGGVLRSLGR